MWPKSFWETKIVDNGFKLALALITIIVTQSWTARVQYNNQLKEDLAKRPTTEYVTTQIQQVKDQLVQGDTNVANALKQHIEESTKTDEMQTKLLQSVDNKVNILLSRTK